MGGVTVLPDWGGTKVLPDYMDVRGILDIFAKARALHLCGPPAEWQAGADASAGAGAEVSLVLFPLLELLELEDCAISRLAALPSSLRHLQATRHRGASCAAGAAGAVDLAAFLRGAEQLLSLSWTCADLRSSRGAGALRGLQRLDLSHNALERVEGLASCTQLEQLDLGHNKIASAAHVHMELPEQLRTLVLCHNQLAAVADLDRLLSLQALDLTANLIEGEEALAQLARLPCLETLWLHDNPLARREGYWARCAAAFAEARGGGAPIARGGAGGVAVGAGAAARAPPMEKVFVDGVLITHPVLALT